MDGDRPALENGTRESGADHGMVSISFIIHGVLFAHTEYVVTCNAVQCVGFKKYIGKYSHFWNFGRIVAAPLLFSRLSGYN